MEDERQNERETSSRGDRSYDEEEQQQYQQEDEEEPELPPPPRHVLSSAAAFIPQHVSEAYDSIAYSLSLIQDFVTDTAAQSSQTYEVCPSSFVLFSPYHADAFRETVMSFKRITADAVRKCGQVREAMASEKVSLAVATAAHHAQATEAATAAEAEQHQQQTQNNNNAAAGVEDETSRSSCDPSATQTQQQQQQHQTAVNHNHRRGNNTEHMAIASEIQQAMAKAAPECLEASEGRVINSLMRQLFHNDATAEVFAQMASVAKTLEELRSRQDLASVYRKRAEELQAQFSGGGGGGKSQQQSQQQDLFSSFGWEAAVENTKDGSGDVLFTVGKNGGDSKQRGLLSQQAATTTQQQQPLPQLLAGDGSKDSSSDQQVHKVANEFGRLTVRMKEKWELAEVDCALAEANLVSLEAENALLARRVRDLEDRLSLSSASAAERKVQLVRERARSARLLQHNAATTANNNNSGQHSRRPPSGISSIRSERGGGGGGGSGSDYESAPSSRNATPTGVRRGGGGGGAGGRANTPTRPATTGTTGRTVGSSDGRPPTGGAAGSAAAAAARSGGADAKLSAKSPRSSGIHLDGVELGYDMACWLARVHRLLINDEKAAATLLSLDESNKIETTKTQQQHQHHHASSASGGNNNNNRNQRSAGSRFSGASSGGSSDGEAAAAATVMKHSSSTSPPTSEFARYMAGRNNNQSP